MKSLVTKSANDVAVALAERIAGSEEAFARLMNERARQIGMRSTNFTNASGLPDDDQVTTARDILTLALRLHDDYPKLYRLFSLKYFTYRGKSTAITTRCCSTMPAPKASRPATRAHPGSTSSPP